MPTYLFPHSSLPESILEYIVSFFGPVKICLPWYMDHPSISNDLPVGFLYPPANLKPEDVFKSSLSQYYMWIKHNQDKSYVDIIKSNRADIPEGEKVWEIRQRLVQGAGPVTGSESDNINKWHLLLHLAAQIEEQQADADKTLKALKDRKSPLEGSIEKSLDIDGLLGDLPGMDMNSSLNDRTLFEVINAWLGLFSGYLEEKDLLITLNRQIMKCLSELWDDLAVNMETPVNKTIVFNLPLTSPYSRNNGAGVDIHHMLQEKIRAIRDLITGMGDNPSENRESLEMSCKELKEFFPEEFSEGTMECALKFLHPVSGKASFHHEKVLEHLYGKTLLLVKMSGT